MIVIFGHKSMKQLFIFILIIFSFFLVSCTIVDDTDTNSGNQDECGEIEEIPDNGETEGDESNSGDDENGSTGWLPWV